MKTRFLHVMLRVSNLEESLSFYMDILGLVETRRKVSEEGRYTLVFLGTEKDDEVLELTHVWDREALCPKGRNFGHISFEVDDIYEFCERLQARGIKLIRPPKDGHIAFIKSPDSIPIELVQVGKPLPIQKPWSDMVNDPHEIASVSR